MVHVEDSEFAGLPPADPEHIRALRILAEKHIPQMSHCARCRADAAGIIGCQNSGEIDRLLSEAASFKMNTERPYAAAASMEGLFVNRHLGEAPGFWIYALEDGKAVLKEKRPAPTPGSGDSRWEELGEILKDCKCLLVSDCGKNPENILESKGIKVIKTEGMIQDTVLPILENREIPKIFTIRPNKCGCTGTGSGCA
jgi:nitrogen fixation protein NifB